MTANLTDRQVREELWVSFRSLLGAYLAAASLGSEVPQALLLSPEAGKLQIVGVRNSLKLELDAENGVGYWSVHGAPVEEGTADLLDEGAFRLHLDATFDWSGKPDRLAIDQVAEALAIMAVSPDA